MPRLLVLQHCPTAATRALGSAVLEGAALPELEQVEVLLRSPLEAVADDVLGADAVVVGTPANFGYMSGALKHFFDSHFLALGGALDAGGAGRPTSGRLPTGLWVHGRYDTTGAIRSVESITGALGWRAAAPVLDVLGDVEEQHLADAHELGATLAALALEQA